MSKLSNTIAMLEILSNKRKYSINELAEKLETSPRMVRYYKEELEKAGYYIESIPGKYGGYILVSDIYLPKVGVSSYDVELLLGIKNFLEKNSYEYINIFNSYLDKIKGLYNSTQQKFNDIKIINTVDDKEKFDFINKAIKENLRVKISTNSMSLLFVN